MCLFVCVCLSLYVSLSFFPTFSFFVCLWVRELKDTFDSTKIPNFKFFFNFKKFFFPQFENIIPIILLLDYVTKKLVE